MKKEITVLDTKRSNAINIGLTVLPTPRTIKAAILKMDSSVINKEGIEVSLYESNIADFGSLTIFLFRSENIDNASN